MDGARLNEQDISDFTDAVNNCIFRLSENFLYNHNRKSEIISHRSILFSQEMYECMLIIFGRMSTSQIQYSKNNMISSTNEKDKSRNLNHNNRYFNHEVINTHDVADGADETELPEENFYTTESQNDPFDNNEIKIDVQDEPIVDAENKNQTWERGASEESDQDSGIVASSSSHESSDNNLLDSPITRIVISNVEEENRVDLVTRNHVETITRAVPESTRKQQEQAVVGRINPGERTYEQKSRIIKLAIANPDWSIEQLKKQSGFKGSVSRAQISTWITQKKFGGSYCDKIKKINNWVCRKCIEYKRKNKEITLWTIQTWGKRANEICLSRRSLRNFYFAASTSWAQKIKAKFDKMSGRGLSQQIRQLKIEVEPELEENEEAQYPEEEIIPENFTESSQVVPEEAPVVIRGRGRPRKTDPPVLKPGPKVASVANDGVVKRKRGRPRKSVSDVPAPIPAPIRNSVRIHNSLPVQNSIPVQYSVPIQTPVLVQNPVPIRHSVPDPNSVLRISKRVMIENQPTPVVKRKVGRPRKYPLPTPVNNVPVQLPDSPHTSAAKNSINTWVYNQCVEYQKNNKFFSKKLVSEWFNEAKKACLSPSSYRYHNYSFSWLNNFKKMYGIVGSSCILRIDHPSISHAGQENDNAPSLQPVGQIGFSQGVQCTTIGENSPPQLDNENHLQQNNEEVLTTNVPNTDNQSPPQLDKESQIQQNNSNYRVVNTDNVQLFHVVSGTRGSNEIVEEPAEMEVDTRLKITDVLSMFASGLVTLQPTPKQENILFDIE